MTNSVSEYTLVRERLAGVLALIALIISFVIANSSFYETYWFIHHTPVSVRIGEFGIDKPLISWINKGLMVFFFLLVGLKIKLEIFEGQLAGLRQLVLPAMAALGGMIAPAVIYLMVNGGDPVIARGWAIPMATDIVLALAALSLFRGRVPESLFIFLAALAIFDDVGAILVIALFYPETLSVPALMFATVGVVALIILNRFKVVATAPYVLIGVFLWVALLKSGLHATLAGIVVAIAFPLYGNKKNISRSPVKDLERSLNPWVVFGIVPLFIFFNAGIVLPEFNIDIFYNTLSLGIVLGLFFGKPIGIMGMTWLAIRLKISRLPGGVTWTHMYGISLLAGIGFTMSLFIISLAFTNIELLAIARFAIIIGSFLSATAGLALLSLIHNIRK